MAVCCHRHSDTDYLRLFLVEMRTLTFVSERVLTLTTILLMARSSFPITALVRDLLGRTDLLYVTRPVASTKKRQCCLHCLFRVRAVLSATNLYPHSSANFNRDFSHGVHPPFYMQIAAVGLPLTFKKRTVQLYYTVDVTIRQ